MKKKKVKKLTTNKYYCLSCNEYHHFRILSAFYMKEFHIVKCAGCGWKWWIVTKEKKNEAKKNEIN